MAFVYADACDMTELAPDNSADLVFEKSTLDAFFCDDGDHALKVTKSARACRYYSS